MSDAAREIMVLTKTDGEPGNVGEVWIPIPTGEAGRPPTSTRSQAIHQACCLTSCHSAKSHHVGLRALIFSLNLD
jgi:hypothetical protein